MYNYLNIFLPNFVLEKDFQFHILKVGESPALSSAIIYILLYVINIFLSSKSSFKSVLLNSSDTVCLIYLLLDLPVWVWTVVHSDQVYKEAILMLTIFYVSIFDYHWPLSRTLKFSVTREKFSLISVWQFF